MTIRRQFTLLALLFLFSVSINAQQRSDFLKPTAPIKMESNIWKSYGTMTFISTAVCVGGDLADIATSGPNELNPILRNAHGSINRKLAFGLGMIPCGISFLLERKHPKLASVFRFASGGVHGAVAIHNRYGVIQ